MSHIFEIHPILLLSRALIESGGTSSLNDNTHLFRLLQSEPSNFFFTTQAGKISAESLNYLLYPNVSQIFVVLLGSFLFVFSLLFTFEKSTRRAYVFLGVFSLTVAIEALCRFRLFDVFLEFQQTRAYLEFVFEFLTPMAFLGFVAEFCGSDRWRLDKGLILGFGLVLFSAVLSDFFGISQIRSFQPALWGLLVLTSLYLGVFALQKLRTGAADDKILASGILVLGGGVIADLLVTARLISIPFDLIYWGVDAVLLALAFLVTQRYLEVFRRRDFFQRRLACVLDATKKLAFVFERSEFIRTCFLVLQDEGVFPRDAIFHILMENSEGGLCLYSLASHGIENGETQNSTNFSDFSVVSESDKLEFYGINEPQFLSDGCFWVPVSKKSGWRTYVRVSGKLPKTFSLEEREIVDAISVALSQTLERMSHISEAGEKARMRTEILAAESVQQTLLPAPIELSGVRIRTHSCVAGEIGGDWFGYYHVKSSNRLFFFIGDVTGHGIPSTIISGVACGAVYGCEKILDDLSECIELTPEEHLLEVAESLNYVIYRTGRFADRLMTMAMGCLDVSTGQLTVVNAGHPHPFIVSPIGECVENIVSRGQRLGGSLATKLQAQSFQLRPGDSIFLYTDGLLENTGSQERIFSHLSLKKLLERNVDAEDLNSVVLNYANEIWGEKVINPDDDVSLLTFTWEGLQQTNDSWGFSSAKGF